MAPPAERRSLWSTLVGGVVLVGAGALLLLKLLIGKLIFIAVVWAGIVWAAHVGGWLGIALIVVIALAAIAFAKAHIA